MQETNLHCVVVNYKGKEYLYPGTHSTQEAKERIEAFIHQFNCTEGNIEGVLWGGKFVSRIKLTTPSIIYFSHLYYPSSSGEIQIN